MPQKLVIPAKADFLMELGKLTPRWNLTFVNTPDRKTVFALTPTIDGPLMIGDEMGINNPIVPITNNRKAFYECAFSADNKDLPNSHRKLEKIWLQALATYEFVKGKQSQNYCTACCGKRSYGTGLTKEGNFCKKCFGMGTIYTYGPQQRLGKRLLKGSSLKFDEYGSLMVEFQPEGLSALLSLYDHYHTGIVTDIAQDYLEKHIYSIIRSTFPVIKIYITYDHNEEQGLCDFVHDVHGTLWNRHFYLPYGNVCINLYTGKKETPDKSQFILVTRSGHLPDRDRWNVSLDILRNLCKFA